MHRRARAVQCGGYHRAVRGRIVASVGLLAIGCRTTPTADSQMTPEPTSSVDTPSRERPAFLVQMKRATLVVPIDPSAPLVRVDGIWTGGRDLYGRFETSITTGRDGTAMPICADATRQSGCRMGPDRDRIPATVHVAATSERVPWWWIGDVRDRECRCVAVDGISTDHEPLDPDVVAEANELGMSPEEFVENCLEDELPDLVPTAMLGGVLYMTGMGHSGTCAGMNIYDGASRPIPVRPDAMPLRREMPRARECVEIFSEIVVDWIGVTEPDCILGDPACNCRGEPEMEAWLLHRGSLVQAIGEIEPVGGGCSCISQVPIAAATCPSPSDPCGDPVGFTTIDQAKDDFWIATHADVGFVLRNDRMLVVHRGDPRPIRDEPIPAPGIDVIGVEYHADAALLEPPEFPRSFRVARPSLAKSDESFSGDASKWGDRCVVHLREKRWDDAEAACFAGLEEGGSNKTRGALTYNLGRVAEGRGDPERALLWYRRSDRLRPGNATVKERIDSLAPRD
jgi:hypothetical protein